jgi:glycosyltransferase involved in cell wall biosynthesis
MKILFTLHYFFPEHLYGAERICIRQMRYFIKAGHTVGLFYPGNETAPTEMLEKEGLQGLHLFPVRYLRTKAQVLLSIWKPHVASQFRQVLRSFRPDVVLLHQLVRLSLDLPAVARKENVPTAYFLQDHYLACPCYSLLNEKLEICSTDSPARCLNCLFTAHTNRRLPFFLLPLLMPPMILRKKMTSQVMSDIDLFISPSQSVLSELENHGLIPSKAATIPSGVETDRFAEPYKPHSPVRFGFMGNMNRKKGLHVVVEAFHGQVSKSLVIRGFDNLRAMDQFRRAHPSCEAKLELFDPDVTSFFKEVDALIVPSIWLENQPTVILESFAFGKPVLCSRIGGIGEFVKDGHGGLLFEPGDSRELRNMVERLSARPEELCTLAASIPRRPTSDESIQAVMSAIESLVKQH